MPNLRRGRIRDYPKCPYVVCLNFGLDPSTCDPNPGGESSELAAAETEPPRDRTPCGDRDRTPSGGDRDRTPSGGDRDRTPSGGDRDRDRDQAVETETEPQAVETETEPQAVETETEPQAVETETEPQAVEAVTWRRHRRERPFRRPRFHRNRHFRRFRIRGVGPSHLRFDDVHGIQKFATELRHSGKYLRTGFSYIPTPGGGKRPSLRLAPGQTVRAVMITPKGTLGRTSWRENGSWSDVRVSEEASSWNAFVSSDAYRAACVHDRGSTSAPASGTCTCPRRRWTSRGASTSRRGPPIRTLLVHVGRKDVGFRRRFR